MNNPFKKKETNLVVPILLGAAASAAITYLFMSEDGTEIREKISATVKEGWKSVQEQLPFSADDLEGIKNSVSEKIATVLNSAEADTLQNEG